MHVLLLGLGPGRSALVAWAAQTVGLVGSLLVNFIRQSQAMGYRHLDILDIYILSEIVSDTRLLTS